MTDVASGTSSELAAFDRLHPVVQHHVVNALGWSGLRPLQAAAVEPVLRGEDCLLIAPTAGGKTEAALFPLLTRMEHEAWTGLSVLYVCPLKALLNNLEPRVAAYAAWLGRAAQVRHGDTGAGDRKRQAVNRPSILLTTPESLEAMLVSRLLDAEHMFRDLQAVVVDEVHAFAGDDRGWHLLAVLERLSSVAGRPLQRIGLSATVGNPEALLSWLQGGRHSAARPRSVVAPAVESAGAPELSLDYVGNVRNAAKVLSGIHLGEKRLVFADSRKTVESLAVELRALEVETFVSHSSLSLDERRRAESAFATARDCVIVSTSTLELGIDVGDLDRVIQLGAPATVASVLQRLGRTGRRPGTSRNMTFLGVEDEDFLRAAGLLLLLGEGFVEPVVAPPSPLHIAAQQLLGTALQKGRISLEDEAAWMEHLGLAGGDELESIGRWLVATEHLDVDQGLAFVGPTAEARYGRRNFMELLAVFTAAPELTVLHGRREVGSIDPMLLVTKAAGPRVIALAGRPWEVKHVDWRRRRAHVEPSDRAGRSAWMGEPRAYSFELSNAIRRVLLGATPSGVVLSTRAVARLEALRAQYAHRVSEDARVVAEEDGRVRWWTFAGMRANAVLTAALGLVAPELLDEWSAGNLNVPLRSDATAGAVASALRAARAVAGDDLAGAVPPVSEQALRKLKFAELLPQELAVATLASRNGDHPGAEVVACTPLVSPSSDIS
ncbi:DEAD/DEAH box helicase [Intrasporangium chromatireducens]|uniref:DEAD/DEAH box helicase n=1 Tax=Intrasporangium chromatireducens TaxID=1386088 RepID=UPI0006879C0E|nr:DEAD/DEAH box helicase [Intrasporangium chromatireducens]